MNERDNKKTMFTLLSQKASAKDLAPSAPIPLFHRLSVVSVYMIDNPCKKIWQENQHELDFHRFEANIIDESQEKVISSD